MSGGLYSHTTRANGLVLTAAIYNADHQNHITNLDPVYIGMHADTVSEFRTATDPGSSGSESLPTNLAGELERLRYCISRIVGKTYWYDEPSADLEDVGALSLPALPLTVANGGLGVALSDPGADRMIFWDASAGAHAYLSAGSGLAFSGTSLVVSGINGGMWSGTALSVANGGTGGTTQATARSGLGLGSAATYAVGASGNVIPTLNTATLWSEGISVDVRASALQTVTAAFLNGEASASNGTLNLYMTHPGSFNGAKWAMFLRNGVTIGSISYDSGTGLVSYNTSSDMRLKDNYRSFDPWEVLERLNPIKARWKTTGNDDYVFLAQELNDVLPQMVVPGNDKEPGEEDFMPWMSNYGRMDPIIVKALTDLNQRVKQLEAA